MSTTNGSFEIGDILDFFSEMSDFGQDILDTTVQIEEMIDNAFTQYLDGSQLSNMKASVLAMLDEILAQPDLIDPTALENIISKVKVTIEEAIGGTSIPSLDIDFSDALKEVQKVFPEDLPGIDLSSLKPIVDGVINTLAESGLRLRFVKDNPALDAIMGNPAGAATPVSKTPLPDRGQSGTPSSAPESTFDTLLENFFNNSSLTATIEDLPNKIETTIAESGIMLILEDHLLVLKNNLKNASPISLDLIISEFGGLANALGDAAITIIKDIIQLIIDEFSNLFTEMKVLGQQIGDQINALLALLQLGELPNPGIFTLPAVLFAIPITMASRKGSTDLPDFANIVQDTYDITNHPFYYGNNQIADGVLSTIFGLAGAVMEDNHKYKLHLELAEKIWGCLNGALAQVFSIPTDYEIGSDPAEKDLSVITWDYQWFMVAWSLFLVPWHYIKEKRLQQHPIAELLEPVSGLLLEMIHLILFSIQFNRELTEDYRVSSRDERIGAASILDPIPGLLGSFFSLIGMGTEPFNNPNTPATSIEQAIDTIQITVAVSGQDSAGEVLNQQITQMQAGGDLRNDLTNAANRLAATGAGTIQGVFDGLDPILRGNDNGTLGLAINDVKNDLTIATIGTNSTDFTTAEDQLELSQEFLEEAIEAFTPLYTSLDAAERLWNDLENTFTIPHTPDVAELINLVAAYTPQINAAFVALDYVTEALNDLQADTGDLAEAKNKLDPNAAETETIGIALANARAALDAYHAELICRLDTFDTQLGIKLAALRQLADQTHLLDQLLIILNPQNTNANTIGKLLSDTHGSLEGIRTNLNSMLSSQSSTAIAEGIGPLRELNTIFTTEFINLVGLFSPIIDNELTDLRADVSQIAEALRQDGNDNFASAYRNLLRSLDLNQAESQAGAAIGVTELRENLSQVIATSLTVAQQKLNDLDNSLTENVIRAINEAEVELGSAQTDLARILVLLDGLSPHPDATTQRNFIAFQEKMAETDAPINTASQKLATAKIEGEAVSPPINSIQAAIADEKPGGFKHQLNSVDTALSAGGTVGTFLQNAHQDLLFEGDTKDDLADPFTRVDAIKKAIVSLRDKMNPGGIPVPTIEKKVIAIVENLNKLESIGSKKTKRKTREDSSFVTYLPIISTFLIKMAYGGLNYWKADHPSPEIASIESDPPGSLTLLAKLETITGNYSGNTDIGWEKKLNDKWESLLAPGVFQPSITLSLEDLAHDIRARVNFQPGFTSKPFNVPNLAPVDIEMTPITIPEDMDVSTPVDIGILSVIDPNGTVYTASDLQLLGADAASFQIINTADGPMLQLAANTDIDFEGPNGPSFSLKIQATDPADSSLLVDKDFVINVIDVDEAPGAITFSPESIIQLDTNLADNYLLNAAGNVKNQDLGSLLATDPEGAVITFSVSPMDSFEIVNNNVLRLSKELTEDLTVHITASDKLTGGLISILSFTIQIEV